MTTTTVPTCPLCRSDQARHVDREQWACAHCGRLLRLLWNGRLVPFVSWEVAGTPKARR
ncbi:MAG: hypothetical protein SH850_17060 [Planctomycetaceae bacterium]|nr:hypothetical protein [Planctomycetaceae bacterium]